MLWYETTGFPEKTVNKESETKKVEWFEHVLERIWKYRLCYLLSRLSVET